MDRKDFLSQILLTLSQSLITLIFAGGATGILTAFKESLPDSFYTIFLYVIWWVIIIMLVWLVLRIILGESPKKFFQWIQKRLNRENTQRLLENWQGKFDDLSDLISSVAENNWQATDSQKDSYRHLHLWFKQRRSKILHLWRLFRNNRTDPTNLGISLSKNDLEYVVLHENYYDPFSVFYEPMNLGVLEYSLRRWDKGDIDYILQKLQELTLEFTTWSLARYD